MPELNWPWLLLLLPLPWLVARWLPSAAVAGDALAAPFVDDRLAALDTSASGRSNDAARARTATRIRWPLALAWALLVLAACGPLWRGEPMPLRSTGRDLLLAVDVSGSMATQDMQTSDGLVDRLTTVKKLGGEFLASRDGDRVGLLLFGSNAYLMAPLTNDRQAVNQQLQEAMIGIAGEQTAIGDAIGIAWKRLKDMPNKHKVLVLVTDGANTAGAVSPEQAMSLIKDTSFRVYTVGVGADQIVVPGFFGDRVVNPSSDLDEELLRHIAQQTGGRYFRARDPAEFARIYAEIDRIEPASGKQATVQPVKTLFQWPLGAAVLLAVVFSLRGRVRQIFARVWRRSGNA